MSDNHIDETPRGRSLLLLSVAATGVVYGDIGTSPIYALRESFHASHGIAPSHDNVLGILSLIFWSLILVISVKYLFLVLRADNDGEGGIIALAALVSPGDENPGAHRRVLVLIGLFGAALLYGDSMITPAISVLSAVEGLRIATPYFEPWILPLTAGILFTLFWVQSRGTGRVGAVFGPIMLIWFFVLAITGVFAMAREPVVLMGLNPVHAIHFFVENQIRGFLVLGSVFLVVTGGEALYADMGHFGRLPIRLTWFTVVLPALTLNYFGQGALILGDPGAAEHPFFLLVPEWGLYPFLALTTVATIIASQAVISGAFSLTRQGIHLGYLPRMRVEHTSSRHMGQIYLPLVNWFLMLACIGLVLGFRSSNRLAAAYGVAVTTDMVFTTILFSVVAWRRWGWNPVLVGAIVLGFLAIDLSFWGANLHKIPHGGWYPLVIAGMAFTIMTTWKRGRSIIGRRLRRRTLPVEVFLKSIGSKPPVRVPGTAVFMDSNPKGIPPALLHNLKHNFVLHELVVFLTILVERTPNVSRAQRYEVTSYGSGMYRVVMHVGFAEDINVPALLDALDIEELDFHPMKTTYFLGRERIIPTERRGMATWREKLFALMSQNALGATRYYGLPPNRVVELGRQVAI